MLFTRSSRATFEDSSSFYSFEKPGSCPAGRLVSPRIDLIAALPVPVSACRRAGRVAQQTNHDAVRLPVEGEVDHLGEGVPWSGRE